MSQIKQPEGSEVFNQVRNSTENQTMLAEAYVRNIHNFLQQSKIMKVVIFSKVALRFIAPPQDQKVLDAIRKRNLKLHVSAYRPTDNMLSSTSFE